MPSERSRYWRPHRELRARLHLVVNRGDAYCARCGGWIAPEGERCTGCGKPTRKGGEAGKGFCGWDVGHDDSDRSRYNGPVPTEHTCCNRRAGARKGAAARWRRVMPGGSQESGRGRADWY